MKDKLLLYLSRLDHPWNAAVAPTLAWLSKSEGCLFDNYYDSYHAGIHFPGGDSRKLDVGQKTGGMVSGERHFQELYFLLLKFDVSAVSCGETMFASCLRNLGIPVLTGAEGIADFYRAVFGLFGRPLPGDIVMVGSRFDSALAGLDAYASPEIYYRRALGVRDSIPEDELKGLCGTGNKIFCFFVDDEAISRFRQRGFSLEIIDHAGENESFASATGRLASRWQDKARGWVLGDPELVRHWVPKACEEDLLPVYAVPQGRILSELGSLMPLKTKVIYGRQDRDQDFFDLSRRNLCFQVVDPCRPPFSSVTHAAYDWAAGGASGGFFEPEFSDDELRVFAREGRVLVSLMFWSGMIRETANLHNLMDLFALTKLRCGLVLTAQSFEYMMHAPLELLAVPLDRGGVYPNVEPVLGSGGIGVAVEALLSPERLEENLREAQARILARVKDDKFLPRGWWPTMDADLERLGFPRRPKRLRLLDYPPYLQVRIQKRGRGDHDLGAGRKTEPAGAGRIQALRKRLGKTRLANYVDPFRPYEFYRAGAVKESVMKAVRAAGLAYMFSKSGFGSQPTILHADDDFLALNYTAGQWDGWTPFETVNDVSDLRKSERILLGKRKPGWVVSTIDSCLWTFSGEMWKRGTKLYEIARFCAGGGASGKLINAKPWTVARYARMIGQR